ncbi:unnamed protein product, partial [Protopolystoma xenopodis]
RALNFAPSLQKAARLPDEPNTFYCTVNSPLVRSLLTAARHELETRTVNHTPALIELRNFLNIAHVTPDVGLTESRIYTQRTACGQFRRACFACLKRVEQVGVCSRRDLEAFSGISHIYLNNLGSIDKKVAYSFIQSVEEKILFANTKTRRMWSFTWLQSLCVA